MRLLLRIKRGKARLGALRGVRYPLRFSPSTGF